MLNLGGEVGICKQVSVGVPAYKYRFTRSLNLKWECVAVLKCSLG